MDALPYGTAGNQSCTARPERIRAIHPIALTAVTITPRIQQFINYANVGDEICLTTHGSVEHQRGLMLGLGAHGLYLVDNSVMAPLDTYDAAAAAAAAEEWAADTGATLWED